MRANESDLLFFSCGSDSLAERLMKLLDSKKRSLRPCRLCDPRRMFKHRTDDANESFTVEVVDLRNGELNRISHRFSQCMRIIFAAAQPVNTITDRIIQLFGLP